MEPTRPNTAGPARLPSRRRRTIWLAAALLVLASCGDDDAGDAATTAAPTPETVAAGSSEPAGEPAGAGAGDAPSVSDVASCLAAAGWQTTGNDELLTAQQQADLETLFGQTGGLTFTEVAFAGSISFFDSSDRAAERADQLSETAVALVPVGSALISVEAGSGYEDAVSAAESCLT